MKTHIALQSIGLVSLLASAAVAIVMVTGSGGEHFDSPHSWIGLVSILLVIEALSLGLIVVSRSLRVRAKAFRLIHRFSGWTAAILLPVTMLMGFLIVGLI